MDKDKPLTQSPFKINRNFFESKTKLDTSPFSNKSLSQQAEQPFLSDTRKNFYSPSQPKAKEQSNRFIPIKQSIDLLQRFELSKTNEDALTEQADNSQYREKLHESFFDSLPKKSERNEFSSTILKFKSESKASKSQSARQISHSKYREIPKTSYKTLDAHYLVDDFYLNLLDWSSTNFVGVALFNALYIYDYNKGIVEQLMSLDTENFLTAVKFNPE